MALTQIAVISRKTLTTDELVMIPAGYYHVIKRNPTLVHEHPPLTKILAALPLLLFDLAPPPTREEVTLQWDRLMRFWTDNSQSFEQLSFWTRVPSFAITVLLGILIFLFTRDLFGRRSAVFAVALFSLEPTVLAHGRVVQTDVAAAFGFLLFFFALYRYGKNPKSTTALGLGLAVAIAVLAKFSMLLVVPIIGVMFLWRLWRPPGENVSRLRIAAHATIAAAAVLLLINGAYLFRCDCFNPADASWVAMAFPSNAKFMKLAIQALSYLLPTDFVLGVAWQLHHNATGHPASLLGEYSRTGWWYYFPVAFSLKTTLAFLILSIVSLIWCAYEFVRSRDKRFLWVLGPFVLYTAFVMMSKLNIGVRYYLPAFSFLFIAGGVLIDRLIDTIRTRRFGLIVATVLFAWIGAEAIRAFPDHMSYMNQLTGNNPGWMYLSDSNVEWGDDVKEVAKYLRDRGETQVRAVTLGGFLTFRFYGIESINLIEPEGVALPETRYTVIGASFLNGSTMPEGKVRGRVLSNEERVDYFEEYRHRTPEAIIGNSIYIFRERE
jgi:4-amino-4-deoxy-L-arabinose transferase-like glycosyltransferase